MAKNKEGYNKSETVLAFNIKAGCWYVNVGSLRKAIRQGMGQAGAAYGRSLLTHGFKLALEEVADERAEAKRKKKAKK